jgi:hypothetical protein
MDEKLYKEIILCFLFPTMANQYDFDCIFHQDNDPKHNSKLCKSVLKDNNINWVKNYKFNKRVSNYTLF